jgi:MoaA/NifB/PqqE/SkfB family radical SAM enzyme
VTWELPGRSLFAVKVAWSILGRRRRINWPAWFNFLHYKLRVLWDRDLTGAVTLGYTPVSANLWLTSRCNLSCDFCHYKGELGRPVEMGRDLTFEAFEKMYAESPDLQRVLRFALYGGEPLLNRDLERFISFLSERGHVVSVNTNGLLLPKWMEALKRTPPHFLSVSAYPENHQVLAKALPELTSGKQGIAVRLSLMVSGENREELESFLDLARVSGVHAVSIDDYVPNGVSEIEVLSRNDGWIVSAQKRVKEAVGKSAGIEWAIPNEKSNEKSKEKPKRATKCRFFWNSLFLDERGLVSPCCYWRRDTYRSRTEMAWNGPEMRALRESMLKGEPPEKCRSCSGLYEDVSKI